MTPGSELPRSSVRPALASPPTGTVTMVAALAIGLLTPPPTDARSLDATLILRVGDPLAGSTVSFVNQPFTNGNGTIGFTFGLANGDGGVWYDTGVAWLNSSQPTLDDIEDSLGISDAGHFVYSPHFNGEDSIWSQDGLVIVENTPAPGFPAGTTTTFHSRPRMVGDGTAFWVAGFNDAGGQTTLGRALYTMPPGGPISVVVRSDDVVDGRTIARPTGIPFAYALSGDGSHRIVLLEYETPSGTEQGLAVDGTFVATEGGPVGDGTSWRRWDFMSINASGDYLFSAFTTGPFDQNQVIASNGVLQVREGDTVAGEVLDDGMVMTVSLNDLGQAVYYWALADGRDLAFFAEDAADLATTSSLLLATDDTLDVDGDQVDDFIVTGLPSVAGPAINLAEDGFVHLTVGLRPVAGGPRRDAVIRLGAGAPAQLYRATVTDVSAGWASRVGLPLGPTSNNDPGWPVSFPLPGSVDDAGALTIREPLVVYRLLDAAGAPLAPLLRVTKSVPDDVTVSWR